MRTAAEHCVLGFQARNETFVAYVPMICPMAPPVVAYDEAPRPRVLLEGFEADAANELIEGLVPTSRLIDGQGLSGLRRQSWDCMVSSSEPAEVHHDLHLLQFGGRPVRSMSKNGLAGVRFIEVWGAEVYLSDEAPDGWRDELKASVIAPLRETDLPRRAIASDAMALQVVTPLVQDADGNIFAAVYHCQGGPKEVIFLPDSTQPSRAWVTLAFERWALEDPETYGSASDWESREEWMTAPERAAAGGLSVAEQALELETVRLEQAVALARQELAARKAEASRASRRLLTETADELADAVADALASIGFRIDKVDDEGGRHKVEDLHIFDDDWVCLGEVKGHGKGATTTDVLKILRFQNLYQQRSGDLPNALWYIVNQFRDRDPSTRRLALRGQDDDVQEFAESNGVVVDTRDLFRLHRDVSLGTLAAEHARSLLREARGRFSYPDPPAAM